jgi:hypothetical protein
MSQTTNTLLNSGLFAKVHTRGWNPYPAAGKADDTSTGAGETGPGNSTLPYPRVKAEC